MERQKIIKKKTSIKDNDISLKVFCLPPRVTSSEERDASVYEIDIQSDFEIHGGQMKEKEYPVGVSISRVSADDSESEDRRREARIREHRNPFFKAYYPNFLQPHLEENETQSESDEENETQSEKERENKTQSEADIERENKTQTGTDIESETQTDTVRENKSQLKTVEEIETKPETVEENRTQSELSEEKEKAIVEEKRETAVEKADKENQSPSVHDSGKIQNHIKSFIIENFFCKNKDDMKDMFKNFENSLDTNELHLHHHEHHHHYYFDASFMSEKSSSSYSRKGQTKSKKKSWANRSYEEKMFEKLNKTTNYTQDCSTSTFTQAQMSSEDTSNPKAEVSTGVDESLEQIPSIPTKSSMSEESVLCKKSDFIKSHLYSDTDLNKCESQEVESTANESKKNSRSNYSMLVNSLKNLNQLKSPIIITDQHTVPKFSYITCECTSVDTLKIKSSISLCSTDRPEEADETGRTSCESEESIKSTGARKIEVKKSDRKVHFDRWKAKLRTELKQIKEDLQRFEEIHFKEKNCFSVQSRVESEAPETGAEHKIAVYSSKTFIMGLENFRLRNNCERSEFESSTEFLLENNRKSYEESFTNKTSLRPADRKADFKRKRHYRSVRTSILQRV